jgi:hypothetical protein
MKDGTPRVVDGFGPIVFSTNGFDKKQFAPAEKAAMRWKKKGKEGEREIRRGGAKSDASNRQEILKGNFRLKTHINSATSSPVTILEISS